MKLRLLMLSLLFFIPSFGAQLVQKNNKQPEKFALIPKDIMFSEIIPHLHGNECFNLAMTSTDSYAKLCNTQEDKIRLLSCSISLEIDPHRRALTFYAQRFNNTTNLNTKSNCKEFIRILCTRESAEHTPMRIWTQFLLNPNRNDRSIGTVPMVRYGSEYIWIPDVIQRYGQDYSKNNFDMELFVSDLNKYSRLTFNNIPGLYILKLLCAQKFDFNQQDNYGDTLLHLMTQRGYIKGVKYLVNLKKIDLNIKNNQGKTPLHYAIKDTECTKLLIQKSSFNPNIQDNEGNTPLHLATQKHDCIESIKILLNHYATDPNIKNNDGNTPLHCALSPYNPLALKYLLKNRKTDPNVKDKNGDTPLHIAVLLNNVECLENLLKNDKIDPNIHHTALHNLPATPLQYAVQNDKKKCRNRLLCHPKSNPNIKNWYGNTLITMVLDHRFLSKKEKIEYIDMFNYYSNLPFIYNKMNPSFIEHMRILALGTSWL